MGQTSHGTFPQTTAVASEGSVVPLLYGATHFAQSVGLTRGWEGGAGVPSQLGNTPCS